MHWTEKKNISSEMCLLMRQAEDTHNVTHWGIKARWTDLCRAQLSAVDNMRFKVTSETRN